MVLSLNSKAFMYTKRKLCVLFKKEIKYEENSDYHVYTIDKKIKYYYTSLLSLLSWL